MRKLLYLSVIVSLFSFININQPYGAVGTSEAAVAQSRIPSSTPPTPVVDSVRQLFDQINLSSYNLDYEIFRMGMRGFEALKKQGTVGDRNIITIIDYSKPSTEKRFYTIDLDNKTVLFHSLVAHGRNTGENIAKSFSNKEHSNQSSLGFYLTGETYVGSKGYSLRLDGLEKEYNGNLRSRAVVIHSADYVSESWIKKVGRLGRSQGCPALPKEINKTVIDTIKDKTVVFAYFNDAGYLTASNYLNDKTQLASGVQGSSTSLHTGVPQ